MVKTFIVSDENIVNEYGYRVMTDGIELTQYLRNPIVLHMHDRGLWKPNGSSGQEVIGRCINLKKEKGQLIADIEFDVADEFAATIAGKVERDFIRMTSIYADVIETSVDADDILPGQKYETVMTSKLVEISICDIGGNDNALRLSREGQPVKLALLDTITKPDNMSIKKIALAMGLDASISEEALETKVIQLTKDKEAADHKVKELEDQIKLTQKKTADSLIERGIKLGLISEDFKDAVELSFEKDHEVQVAKLTKLINEKEADSDQAGVHGQVKEVLLNGKQSSAAPTGDQECYDYLQKHDPVKLAKIHKEDNEKYVKLAKAYAEGKRYAPKN